MAMSLAAALVIGPSVADAQNPACPSAASSTAVSCTFVATGAEQTYTMPTGVSAVTITAIGAHGGFGNNFAGGGLGAAVTATVPVSAATSALYVEVGTAGGNDNGNAPGGFNGGGATQYAGGGGGASDVRTCSSAVCTDLSADDTRLVVAGGGGGGGGGAPRCGNTGGRAGDSSVQGPGAGGPADTCPGGNGGNGGFGGAGPAGQGGNTNGVAGGGGGGYRGGGAGSNSPRTGGGGGAGSSFWVPGATRASMGEDDSGTSRVVITQAAATTTTLSSSPNPSTTGDTVTYTATVTPAPDGGTVAFADGGATIADCDSRPVDSSSGAATCKVTYDVPGTHTITALYGGADAFSAGRSSPLTQQVESPSPRSSPTIEPPPSPGPPPAAPALALLELRAPHVFVFGSAGSEARCRMRQGRIGTCTIRVLHGRSLLASGRVSSAERSSLTVRLRLSASGRRLLARRLGGVSVRVRAVGITSGGARHATVHTRALLEVEHIRTPRGSFAGDSPDLTDRGRRFLRRLRGKLIAVRSLRCDGYTGIERPGSLVAGPLSLQRARLLCTALRRMATGSQRVRTQGHGGSRPLRSDATESGRAANRRVEVTVVHRA